MKADSRLSNTDAHVIQVSLREFLERLVDERGERFDQALTSLQKLVEERDRLYISKFDASQTAVSAALAAQKEATNTAFLASEKAIVKAETAQADYNIRSNEFRGQLDDQAKTLMPRIETVGLFHNVDDKFKSFDEKLEFLRTSFDGKLESMRINFEKSIDAQSKEIQGLRESRSGTETLASGRLTDRTQQNWSISTIIAFVAILVSAVAVTVTLLHVGK